MNNRIVLFKIIKTIFLIIIILLFLEALNFHLNWIKFPYQNDIREGAMILPTNLLLEGKNPFTYEYQPIFINVYGFVYNFVVFPFAKLFGSTFVIHRIISGVCILCNSLLIYFALRKQKYNFIGSIILSVILYVSMLNYYLPSAKPDMVGELFFLLAIIIPYLNKYSKNSMLISIFLSIIGFYTKPYYIISIVYNIIYIFLKTSKTLAVKYTILTSFLSIISLVIVESVFNAYFGNIFINNAKSIGFSWDYSINQLVFFIQSYWSLSLLFIVLIFLFIFKKEIRKINVFVIGFVISLIILIFKMGGHGGAFMSYYIELLLPFLILMVPLIKLQNIYYILLNAALIINLYFLIGTNCHLPLDAEKKSLIEWGKINNYVKNSNNILNSPAIVSALIENNKPIYDTGQTEYYLGGVGSKEAMEPLTEFNNQIQYSLNQKEFDLIIRSKGPFIIDRFDFSNYTLTDNIDLYMPYSGTTWPLLIYQPIK